ncbi:endo-1,3(4)-beta-glucanase [Phlegmacium glaucopus]|nr:endo-1,3(4)-beta-glucanase [Phlegmacium glaucopus]
MTVFLKSSLLAYLSLSTLATPYTQRDSYTGAQFLNGFSFQAIADPTHGRVNYVDAQTAASRNLTFSSADHFVLRADSSTFLSASGPGRNSFRILSNNQYTTSVMVFNIRHMPQGCGTWPAVWTVGPNWPNEGEIDILEGVNDQGVDQVTLHTSPGCSMPASRAQTGISTGNNCDTAATNNAGCGVQVDDGRSFGPSFNQQGGGWFAVERTSSFIKVWFWPRTANNVPEDVLHGAGTVETASWGTPRAFFPSTNCPISSKFGPHNIVINLTFCGDWAGAVYGSSGCPSTCVDFVNNNPSAFVDAYFDIAWLKVYERK